MSTPTPPPLPSPVPQPIRAAPRSSNTTLWLVLGGIALFGVVGVAVFAAILIPTVGKVRETARRTADASNLRQIAQAALVWSMEHEMQLPPAQLDRWGQPKGDAPATIHAVAAALARDGGLDDAAVWVALSDAHRHSGRNDGIPVLNSDRMTLDPAFEHETVLAWDFVTGLNLNLPPTTPVAWTRGLRPDGTWDPDGGVYGGDGGYIAFLGGNVQFYRDLKRTTLFAPDGSSTFNILAAIPGNARVVGSGPGTLHGATGRAPP